MKTNIINYTFLLLLLIGASCRTASYEFTEDSVNATQEEIVGTWDWVKVLNTQTGKEMDIEEMEGINAEEIKTEFKRNNNYTEYKKRLGASEYRAHKGDWKLENGNMLSTKSKEDWKTSQIVKLSEDSLYLQVQDPVVIVMAREEN